MHIVNCKLGMLILMDLIFWLSPPGLRLEIVGGSMSTNGSSIYPEVKILKVVNVKLFMRNFSWAHRCGNGHSSTEFPMCEP
mgnify:CR=1 FL=1